MRRHYLPNPQTHTAGKREKVVKRMQQHVSWANVVVGASGLRTDPALETGEIIRFPQRNARTEAQPR